MPRNYNPPTAGGQSRFRIWRIQGENPNGEMPWMKFHEQEVMSDESLAERIVDNNSATLLTEYDPTAVVDMYDPTTNQPTGSTMTLAECYAVLFSLGHSAQLARDAAEEAAEPEDEP